MNALSAISDAKDICFKTYSRSILPVWRYFWIVLLHPIFVFVVLQIVSVTLTILWVSWYLAQAESRIVSTDLAFLITGCVLTGIILLGTVMLFVFAIKQSRLNSQQRIFVSSVTHELRSPVASLRLSLETLEQRDLNLTLKKRIYLMMHRDMDRLVHLVDQILVSARLDRGIKMFDHLETFSLIDVFISGVANLTHIDSDLENRVEIFCDPELKLFAAKSAMVLVVENLLENAVKYSKPATPISVRASAGSDGITIEIQDRGFGIEKREIKKIFKMFKRGDVARIKSIRGTGVGLYIVRSVVKVLGGKVWAESSGKNMGSTFRLVLPLNLLNGGTRG